MTYSQRTQETGAGLVYVIGDQRGDICTAGDCMAAALVYSALEIADLTNRQAREVPRDELAAKVCVAELAIAWRATNEALRQGNVANVAQSVLDALEDARRQLDRAARLVTQQGGGL